MSKIDLSISIFLQIKNNINYNQQSIINNQLKKAPPPLGLVRIFSSSLSFNSTAPPFKRNSRSAGGGTSLSLSLGCLGEVQPKTRASDVTRRASFRKFNLSFSQLIKGKSFKITQGSKTNQLPHFKLSTNTRPSFPFGMRISNSHDSVGAMSATRARSARLRSRSARS